MKENLCETCEYQDTGTCRYCVKYSHYRQQDSHAGAWFAWAIGVGGIILVLLWLIL